MIPLTEGRVGYTAARKLLRFLLLLLMPFASVQAPRSVERHYRDAVLWSQRVENLVSKWNQMVVDLSVTQ